MKCANCSEYFVGSAVSLTCYIRLEQENKRLRAELENIIDSAGCCTGEDAQNMLEIAEWALKGDK